MRRYILVLSTAAWALACGARAAETPAQRLGALADRFVGETLDYDPTVAYSTGLPTDDHSRFPDHAPGAIEAMRFKEAADLASLRTIDPADLPTASRAAYAVLKERLEADLQARVCRQELWGVSHLGGWQVMFIQVAAQQPVGTPAARAQALARWGSAGRFIDVEIANLRRGLDQGYSAPKSVVRRVIGQLDGLLAAPVDKSPLYAPAERDPDPAFRAAFARLMVDQINPSIRRYRDYLRNDYLPRAREGVAVSDLPDGAACYQALLRANTTLNRTPQEVYDLGRATVQANKADVVRIGSALVGSSGYAEIIARSKARPENHFQSSDELLAFSREALARARAGTARLVDRMPRQDAVIEPESDLEEEAGVPSHYDASADPSEPGVYRIQLGNWRTETRGEAEVTVVHEAWPGHHLQSALAREIVPDTPLAKLCSNPAYDEGWARYAEAMAEEAGLYQTEDARIVRRVWPARGMVVDPGLHAFHWTRRQAIDYLVESGRFDAKAADDMVDRIAVIPGQLTSYDSGGLEIRALRAQAQTALGRRFDLREFNRTILDEGSVPLSELRAHVEAWIASKPRARK